jgi:cell division protease FtsH
MFERIVSALGGRMAEKLMLNDISTGASSDIMSASAIARSMVTKYGMSDKLGPISFDDSSHSVFIGRDFSQTKSYSEKTAALIDDEVKRIFDDAMEKCEAILLEHKNILIRTADYLLENETMDGDDFRFLCEHDGEFPPKKPKPVPPEAGQDGVFVEFSKDYRQKQAEAGGSGMDSGNDGPPPENRP